MAPLKKSFHVVHAFDAKRGDGAVPISRLIEFAGNLYGTTWSGGTSRGWGTVFEIDGAGHERTIYSFLGNYYYTDGFHPYSGLTAMGKLMYGTTFEGGVHGGGTVYSITPEGTETILYAFGAGSDGYEPAGDLLAYRHILYGTTSYGGNSKRCSSYCGTVFSVTASGKERIIHTFSGRDGARPYGGLIQVHGKFYGTTVFGGSDGSKGTAFVLSTDGTFKKLHSFGNGADGINPNGAMLYTHGALYGTTTFGGAHNVGTVFKLGLDGSESVLYSFNGVLDGARPFGGLTVVNGKLVGTTSGGGGGCGCGTIFAIDFNGKETTLHKFDGFHDGENAQDTLLYTRGALFGTTYTGGSGNYGTVFRLDNP